MKSDLVICITHRDNCLLELRPLLDSFDNLEGKSVLEIGCGRDQQLRAEFESRGLEYCAVDNWRFNEKPFFVGSEYCSGMMEDLNLFDDFCFDFVFACHSFEHCERPVDALREFYRALKKGGRLIMFTPFHCKHQVLDSDIDHLFVLTDLQMMRLLCYVGFEGNVYVQKDVFWKEQDFNLVSLGFKK